jgi:sugar phosphate isomerase/epimerase
MKLSIISDQVDQNYNIAFSKIKELGLEYVELHNINNKSIEEINHEELVELKKSLSKYNLKVSNLSSTIFFLTKLFDDYEVSLFSDEFKVFKGTIDDHLKQIDRVCFIANQLDCENVRVFPFRYPDNLKVEDFDKVNKKVISIMKKAAVIAAKYNVVLVLENCPYSHMPKATMTNEIVDAVNSDHLKLLYDIANSYRAEKNQVPTKYLEISLLEELMNVRKNIKHVHLKDYHYDENFDGKPFIHKAVLEGDIDTTALISYLYMTNYQGYISLEPEVDYENTVKSIKNVINLVNKIELKIKEVEDQGIYHHEHNMNCSQATATTLAPLIGENVDYIYKVMEGFGSGMGIGTACGACTGMNAIISLAESGGLKRLGETKHQTKIDVITCMECFLDLHNGTCLCSDLKIDDDHCNLLIAEACKIGFLYLLMSHIIDIDN